MNKQSLLEFHNKHDRFFMILNSCVFVLLGIFIFCTPFPYTTAITNISFYLAILIALALMIFNPAAFTFKTPLTYPLIAFFLWSLLSIFWSLSVENTISDVRGHLLNHIVLYFLLINFFNSMKRLKTLAWIIVFSAATFSVLGMIYYYVVLGNPVQSIRLGGLTSTMKNVSTELPGNAIGTLNIPAIFFCLYFFPRTPFLYQRIKIIFCALASFVAIILTQSRGTLVALVTAGGTLLLMTKKKLIPIFLVAVIVLIFFTPFKNRLDSASFSERLKINYVAYEVLKDYPLKGIGFGLMTFHTAINKEAYISKLPEKYRPLQIVGPHNLLLDITVRLGVIGLILFLAILFVFIKMCWKTIRQARDADLRRLGIYVAIAFFAYFIIGLAEPLFVFTAPTITFYMFLAMITVLSRLNADVQDIGIKPVGEE